MIDQLNMYGMTKLEVSLERIKQIEPRGGSWYLAFSGGMVGDFCWEVRNGILYASDRIFNTFEPDATVRKYTKADLMEMAQEMEES